MKVQKSRSSGVNHRFGGDWTTRKLEVIAGYLHSYTTALKDKPSPERPFRKAFIDAFAGTGYRDVRRDEGDGADGQEVLFPDLITQEPQCLLDGSAKIALDTEPRFDKYIFIERSQERCVQLQQLRESYPAIKGDIDIRQGDANQVIQDLCAKDWSSRRAVLFLDPYGMQVEWSTLEAVARTSAIDLWLLFPLGIGVNRLLKKSGEIPEGWRRRLDLLLGTDEWYDEFYKVESTPTLFNTDEEHVIKASMDSIGRFFVKRLESIFAGVAQEPGVLRNSTNSPLYLLCFAVGNMKGKDIALRIANSLLTDLR
jgi:three-Cys-motif partner protein